MGFLVGVIYLSRLAIQMARATDSETAADLLGRWIVGVRVILVLLFVAVVGMVFKPAL